MVSVPMINKKILSILQVYSTILLTILIFKWITKCVGRKVYPYAVIVDYKS